MTRAKIFLPLVALFASGCFDRYYTRAELYARARKLPSEERRATAIAAERADSRAPVRLRLSSVVEAEPATSDTVELRTFNVLKATAVASFALAVPALVGGLGGFIARSSCPSGETCSMGDLVGLTLIAIGSALALVGIILAVVGTTTHPAETRRGPFFDAAAGAVRF